MPPDDDDDDINAPPDARTVPYDRLQKATRDRKAARAELAAAQARITELEGQVAAHGEVVQQLETLKGQAGAWAEERAMISAGLVDEEGQDLARAAYNRMPEANRPKGGIGEWLQAKDALPRGVRAYMQDDTQANAPVPGAEAKAPPQRPDRLPPGAKTPTPNSDAKARNVPGAPQTFGGGAVSGMSNKEFGESRAAVWASLGREPPKTPAGLGKDPSAK